MTKATEYPCNKYPEVYFYECDTWTWMHTLGAVIWLGGLAMAIRLLMWVL